MKRSKLLHVVLTTIGVGALLAYVMACRPSWSPDGSKILFPYSDRESEVRGIALFDKTTGKTRSVFVLPAEGKLAEGEAENVPVVQWDSQGKRAIVIWGDKAGGTHIRIQPIDSAAPARDVLLKSHGEPPFTWAPLPEVDGSLLITGRSTLLRVDVETGKVAEAKLKGADDYVLFGTKNRAYYVRMVSGAEPDYEIGTVDARRLVVTRERTLGKEDVGELSPFFSLSVDGSTIAVPGSKENKYYIHIISQSRLQNSIPLELSPETATLGNLQWSPDGKTIYAAVGTGLKDRDRIELGVGEITVATGAMRMTRLLRVAKPEHEEIILVGFQIGLSPDGKTIATSPTYLLDAVDDEADCALYLVDLTTPERRVTKVPISQERKIRNK